MLEEGEEVINVLKLKQEMNPYNFHLLLLVFFSPPSC